ncbi:hypothetical protein BGZ60DRAFT_212877 [Tricladium varicosporioides]|nr:hypothetical protein BGZ60DRAFT_212877 [Hymenoscyphus varicosporioides]
MSTFPTTAVPMSSLDCPSPPLKPLTKPIRHREKVQLSCTLCRAKKLKCDRNQPCRSCAGRGLGHSCTYVHGRLEGQRALQRPSNNIQNKINQLEGLVVSLMGTLNSRQTDSPKIASEQIISPDYPILGPKDDQPPAEALAETFGRITLENAEAKYVDSTHWSAILDGIAELKDHFEDSHYEGDKNRGSFLGAHDFSTHGPQLLHGLRNHATREEILAAIPEKQVLDRFISKYLGSMDMSPVVIHRPTFLKQYEKFWESPSSTPIMWIGMMYCMMALAVQFHESSQILLGGLVSSSSTRPNPAQNLQLQVYREKVVQCLVLGDYTKGSPFTIETLLLYFAIEHFQSSDTQVGPWILFGMIARIAMRMGYHRDPSHSPRITPFQGEMRRRAWAMILQVDLATSQQVGLPRAIRPRQADTLDPRNLTDDDFHEDIVELPPSRPDSEMTPLLYIIWKNKLLFVGSEITDLAGSATLAPYSEVLRLDKMLYDVRESMPVRLQWRNRSGVITDPARIIMRRLYLDIIFHAARCNLHRRYLPLAKPNTPYINSKNLCLDSALQLLENQSSMYDESQPGGWLFEDRWKVSSLVNHDYLLGTTILCLQLDYDLRAGQPLFLTESSADCERRKKIVQALQGSYQIWVKSSTTSREAQKAAEALEIVLGKAKRSVLAVEEDFLGVLGSSGADHTPSTSADTPISLREENVALEQDPGSAKNVLEGPTAYGISEGTGPFENLNYSDAQMDTFGWV